MQAYVFSVNAGAAPVLLVDLKEVKQKCRAVPKDARDWVRVSLEDFPSDKASFIAACNGRPPAARSVIKKWRVGGPRGGRLIEIPVDSEE